MITFKQFLNEASKKKQKKQPKPKARPKKTLWFNDRNFWINDLRFSRNGYFSLMSTEEEESSDIFATDKDLTVCFGFWRPKINQGVTFFLPRQLNAIYPGDIKKLKVINVQPPRTLSPPQVFTSPS